MGYSQNQDLEKVSKCFWMNIGSSPVGMNCPVTLKCAYYSHHALLEQGIALISLQELLWRSLCAHKEKDCALCICFYLRYHLHLVN